MEWFFVWVPCSSETESAQRLPQAALEMHGVETLGESAGYCRWVEGSGSQEGVDSNWTSQCSVHDGSGGP